MTDDNAKRNKDSKDIKKGIEDNNTADPSTVTNHGNTSRDITDTADISRASIAKGRGSGETAADIVTGHVKHNESIIQGITQDNRNLGHRQELLAQDNPPKEVVDSGTSLRKDKSIDKADIYPTGESGTRHIDRAQEKPVKKMEDKQQGSWKIEEEND
jgi:hypothetical protein